MNRRSIIWLLIGLLSFTLSNGNWTVPIMAWMAPVFLLQYLRGSKLNLKLLRLFVLFIPVTKIMLNEIVPNGIGALSHILIVYYALLWFIPYWIYTKLRNHKDKFLYTLIFPAAAVTFEYLNTVFFGSWASIAYSQFGNLPLMQLASVTGIWGITFLVLWFGSVVDWYWHETEFHKRLQSGGLIYGIVFLVVMAYGGMRLLVCSLDEFTENIISFTPTDAIAHYFDQRDQFGFQSTFKMARESRGDLEGILDESHQMIFDQMEDLALTPAAVMIWPEASIDVLAEQEEELLGQGEQFALENELYLLMAYYLLPKPDSSDKPENKAVLINPQGQREFTYLKAYPVPGAAHKAGDGIIPSVETPFGKIGTAICYDMDFTGLIHQVGRKKIDIMMVPSWDWKAIDPLHTHMAVFRAIENGFSLIRQTGMGLSMATDPTGRVLAQMDYFTSPDNVMIAQVPKQRCSTIYTWIGDAFAWMSMLFVVLVLISNIIYRPMSTP